ncbi:MAG: hypothetical protein COV66_08740 [Nitrospinae bacterium CG11_big_fil_rev_8_21_14_0_20_45_15]|nr:MAG: hypothetical protein COV66_08740 [Nitrospinae bacterium CG11_big_fil_rev_8_21_14_0_20_45_15]
MELKIPAPVRLQKISYLLVMALLQMLVVSTLTVSAWAAQVATLENVSGDVRIYSEGKNRGRKGMDGASLLSKHIVKTEGDDAFADIVFADGSRVRVMPNSAVYLSKVEINEGGSEIDMKLAAGKIFNVVNKLSKNSRYTVNTQTAIAGVKGTVFSVEAVSDDKAVFMVKEGRVEASNSNQPDKTVEVSDLHKTTVNKDNPPEEPVEMTAEEIAMFNLLDDIFKTIGSDIQEKIQDDVMQQLRESGGDFLNLQ